MVKFKAENTPKERFALFEKEDNFIWTRKFRNELREAVDFPKGANYNLPEQILKDESAFLVKELAKSSGVSTDVYLNSAVLGDMLNEVLVAEGLADSVCLGAKEREEVLSILDEGKKKTKTRENSNYLRATTFLASTYNKGMPREAEKPKEEEEELEESDVKLAEKIEESFRDGVAMGDPHPSKGGVVAEKVLELKPLKEISGVLGEITFPENTGLEGILLENDPLDKEIINQYDLKGQKGEYSRSFNKRTAHSSDIYNNYLLFVGEKTALVHPVGERSFLKKVKRWEDKDLLSRKRSFNLTVEGETPVVEAVVEEKESEDELDDLF